MVRAFASVMFLPKFHDKDCGFQVNDEVKIVAKVDVLENVPLETEMTNRRLMKEASTIMEGKCQWVSSFSFSSKKVTDGVCVCYSMRLMAHCFCLHSQVESVKRIFEKHPDIAVDFRAKNQHVRSACMSSLLGLIETLCKSLHKLSNEDLIEADIALKYVKDEGFKVDWLEKNLEQVRAKKMKELSDLAMLQEIEEKALNKKRKLEELDALAEEQKKKLSATRTPLSFNDVV